MDILFYIEKYISDTDLTFNESFLPDNLSKMIQQLASVEKIFYSVPSEYSGKLKGDTVFTRKGEDDVQFWKELFNTTDSKDIARIRADSAFLDGEIIEEMIQLHNKYRAEFTYSENLPAGFSCEIVSKELISNIPDFEENTLPLSRVIKSNINHFDIELYYREPDLRDKRISFLTSNERERKIMENLLAINGGIPTYNDIDTLIKNNPGTLFVGPSYLEIELTGRCDLKCIFCYRETLKSEHGDMDPSVFKKILEDMNTFNLPYSICFGGSGEPMMHPGFYELLELTVKTPLVQSVVVETNGTLADGNYKSFIKSSGSKVTTIFNINGIDSDTYRTLHGTDDFQRVYDNIISLTEVDKEESRLYVQIMKINETEQFIDSYYDLWEKNHVPIILQKQNTYLGKIPDRRYSDLSPLKRNPCWHLQRDLYITSKGDVCFCKQDIDGEISADNITNRTVAEIWAGREKNFVQDYKKKYPSAPDCASCDEWYTFNL